MSTDRLKADESIALEAQIQELLAAVAGTEASTPDTDLFDAGVLDSLQFVQLLAALEQTFGVRIDLAQTDLDHFRSVRAIAGFLSHAAPPPVPDER